MTLLHVDDHQSSLRQLHAMNEVQDEAWCAMLMVAPKMPLVGEYPASIYVEVLA